MPILKKARENVSRHAPPHCGIKYIEIFMFYPYSASWNTANIALLSGAS